MEEAKTQVSRREILKALAAGGSALAASAFLPGKWTRPLVEAGVLPAHAQSSCAITVEITEAGPCGQNCVEGAQYYMEYAWSPALIPDGHTVLMGGVPVLTLAISAGPATGPVSMQFSPGIGFSNYTIQVILSFDTCQAMDSVTLGA